MNLTLSTSRACRIAFAGLTALCVTSTASADFLVSGSVTTDVAIGRCAFFVYPDVIWAVDIVRPAPATFAVGTTSFTAYDDGIDPEIVRSTWGFLGTYTNDEGGTGVVLSVSQEAADYVLAGGTTWEQLFAYQTEAAVVADLDAIYSYPIDSTEYNDAYSRLFDFANVYHGTWVGPEEIRMVPEYGAQAKLIGFSSPKAVGSVTANPVPEPATMSVFVLGLAAVARRRRRK